MRFLLFLLTFSGFLITYSQDKAVLKPVKDLFVAMETNDAKLAESLFIENATLSTIVVDSLGEYEVKTVDAQRLVEAFGREKNATWHEPTWNEVIQIDKGFATVWTEYAFYIDDQLSHCGVDAFQLIWNDNHWKIISVTDTRNKDCSVPSSIKKKSKKWKK